MSDTEESVVAGSVDSGATISPSILCGLERLKCRSSNQLRERKVRDDEELSIGKCVSIKSQTVNSSHPSSQGSGFSSINIVSTQEDVSVSPSIPKQSKDDVVNTEPKSKQESHEVKKKSDDDSTPDGATADETLTQCLDADCICKEVSVPLNKLMQVQDLIQKLLKAGEDQESSDYDRTRHLLRTMQQHLRQLSKSQHKHLQSLRQLMKRPSESQPPDLKFQLQQIMSEKQQMLQLLKTHRKLASEHQIANKESFREMNDPVVGSSQSDNGSLKSMATRNSSSADRDTTQSHLGNKMVSEMASTLSHPNPSCPPHQAVDANLESVKVNSQQQICTSASTGSTNVSLSVRVPLKTPVSILPTRSHELPITNVKQTLPTSDGSRHSFSGGRKWNPPFASGSEPMIYPKNQETGKSNQIYSVGDPKPLYQMSASPSTQVTSCTDNTISVLPILASNRLTFESNSANDVTSGTKYPFSNTPTVRIVSSRTVPNIEGKEPVPLPQGQSLTVADINKVVNEHLLQQRQNSSKNKPAATNLTSMQVFKNQNPIGSTPGTAKSQLQPPVTKTVNVLNLHIPSRISTTAISQTTSAKTAVTQAQIPSTNALAPTPTTSSAVKSVQSGSRQIFSVVPTNLSMLDSTEGQQVFPTSTPAETRKTKVQGQQRGLPSQQHQSKPASMVQLLEAKLLQPGHDVLTFTSSGNGKVYRASLDSKGNISDLQRGYFSGPSQWTAAVMNRNVSATSKLAWKSIFYKGKSLAMLQQQWAKRQGEPTGQCQTSSRLQQHMADKTPDKTSHANFDPRSIMLVPNLRVQLLMTEELNPMTQEDWEDIPPHIYADIDIWD